MFAEISFPISSFKLFTYKVPRELRTKLKKGMAVNARFRNRVDCGFVISISKQTKFKGNIQAIIDYNKNWEINKELWNTLEWMSQYYLTPMGKTLKLAHPLTMQLQKEPIKKIHLKISEKGIKHLSNSKGRVSQKIKLLKELHKNDAYTALSNLQSQKKINAYSHYKGLLKDKLITMKQIELFQPSQNNSISAPLSQLSNEQKHVFSNIISKNKGYNAHLLHGVTGSGKTEIYIHLCQKMFNEKKASIVLVPEIILTHQMIEKFESIFKGNVIAWHSRISKKQKQSYYHQIKANKQSIIIGTRSALFLPVANLGLIIIDEEHDSSYKQAGQAPYYHARDVALVRARNAKASIILGSATPSIESYYNTQVKKINLLKLNERYGPSTKPEVKIVDMQTQIYPKTGKQKIISSYLIDQTFKALDRNEQTVLLYNRRGFSLSIQCKQCKEYLYCNQCNVTLTYHKHRNQLLCHHCNCVERIPKKCIHCNSNHLIYSGLGIQYIEEILNQIFVDCQILRIDSDVKSIKDAPNKIKDFEKQKYQILLGTQMITKGHDFSNVTLVGIINADHGLYLPDFRSGENVFQMISQVIGRSGRRNKQATAVIQSNNYKDQYIQHAKLNQFEQYYELELKSRLALNYPPISRLIRLVFLGSDKKHTLMVAKEITNKIKLEHSYEVLGPFSAIIEKINKKWRYHSLIKANKAGQFQQLFINKFGLNFIERPYKSVRVKIDIDPLSMF